MPKKEQVATTLHEQNPWNTFPRMYYDNRPQNGITITVQIAENQEITRTIRSKIVGPFNVSMTRFNSICLLLFIYQFEQIITWTSVLEIISPRNILLHNVLRSKSGIRKLSYLYIKKQTLKIIMSEFLHKICMSFLLMLSVLYFFVTLSALYGFCDIIFNDREL